MEPLASAPVWRGRVLLQLGLAAFVGHAGENRLHRHYAVQIAFASRGDVCVQRSDATRATGAAVGCPANVAHKLLPSTEPVALIYLEPTSQLGRLAHRRFRESPVLATSYGLHYFWRLEAAVRAGKPEEITQLLGQLLQPDPGITMGPADSRVSRVVESASFPAVPPPLAQAAAVAALSPSRFSHLFAAEMGIAYRAFVKWRKLMLALQAVAAGADLTSAAHAAGFSDSAHLSRTFQSMFGLSPSRALAGLELDSPAPAR